MENKYRFPNSPHIVYADSRLFNNIVIPPTYTKTPEMSQTSSVISTCCHNVLEERKSMESDAAEDERLLVSIDVPNPDRQPQPSFSIHPTVWLRLLSVSLSLGASLALLNCGWVWGPKIVVSVSFLISVSWNLWILICNTGQLEFGTRPLSKTRTSKSDKKHWRSVRIAVEVAVILGALISIIIIFVTTLPARQVFICRTPSHCGISDVPTLDVQAIVAVVFGAVGIAIELLSFCLDGGACRSYEIGLIPKTPGSNEYVFQSICTSDSLLPISGVHEKAQCIYEERKIKLFIPINPLCHILILCLVPLTATRILVPGHRQHDVLVVFIILMAITSCLILLKQLYFAVKSGAFLLNIKKPKEEFQIKHFAIFWHASLILGGIITCIVSLTRPSREWYAGAWWIGREFAWIIIAAVSITVYAIATVDSLYPTYVYIRLGGDPDRMSTWCLKIGLKLKREKEESSTRIFTPQESNYGDNEEK